MATFDNIFDRAMSEVDKIVMDTFGGRVVAVIGGVQRSINVIFDDEDTIQQIAGGQVVNSQPELFCNADEVAGLKKHDAVYIHGVAFYVTAIGRPDGDSLTVKLAHGKPGRPVNDIDAWS
ncbi:hypothetical protein EH228_14735 [Erwinia endophytica]|uniref:head-tail joining protein n=1 Tax=Erwinia endophytica TaxID=1563158 RepID=UPI001265DECE|nr:head-tail joining protein [Erwinia endophytica]KAB8307257.1 hypothetical protein EH228_14735 [Erwinia endophytica]